jgi:hypothetical protein
VVKNGSLRERGFAHAYTRVHDVDARIVAGIDPTELERPCVVHHLVRRHQRHRSTGGHRVARVDDQVHHHLLQLPSIRPHGARVGVELEVEADALAHDALQDPRDPLHDVVQVDLLAQERLRAPER